MLETNGSTHQQTPRTADTSGLDIDARPLSVLYVEEGLSVPAQQLLPLLALHNRIWLVTADTDKEFRRALWAGVRTFPSPRFPVQRAWRSRRLALRILRSERVNLIHSHSATDFLLPRKVPRVAHVHDCWLADMKASWKTSPFLRKIRHLAGFAHYVIPEVISLRRADHVVCVSESLRQEVLENYRLAPERVTVVANGAPLEARALWHAKKAVDRPALIYAGRLHPLKGILPFVESFVERPDIDVPFLILGDGPDMKRIQMLARQDLRIQLPGWVSPAEVRKHLAQTNIFVFPSEREGCPIAVLEAMATGHACVVRDIPVMHELLGEDAGIFCETPGQMLDEVAALATSLERRFELQGLAWERSKVFSWEESAKRLQDVYSLVAERGDSRNGGR